MAENKGLQLLRSRRTVRRFAEQDIGNDIVTSLLEAASVAPSRLDRRPLYFLVIRSSELKGKLAEALRVRPYLEQAPVVITVLADPSLSSTWELDGSAAIENLLLAATALGLGAAWVGSKGSQLWEKALDVLRETAAVPAGMSVVSLVCVGHPAEEKAAYEAGEKLDATRVRYDHWDCLELEQLAGHR